MILKKSAVNQINNDVRQSKMKRIFYKNRKITVENEVILPLEPSFQLTDENLNQGNYVNIETCETDNSLLKFTKIFRYYTFFAYLHDPAGAGAAIKQRLRLSAPTYQKIGSGAATKLTAQGGSGTLQRSIR